MGDTSILRCLGNNVGECHPSSLPVSFLTLPREIRQKILHDSFEPALQQDIGFNTNHAILHYLLSKQRNTCPRPVSAHNIASWASTLSATHKIINTDLTHVLKSRLADLEVNYATKQQDVEGYECPFRKAFRRVTTAGAKPVLVKGLHRWEVVSCLENFRRWTHSGVLCEGGDEYGISGVVGRRGVEMKVRKRQVRRKKLLTGMVRDAVCFGDCRHMPRRCC